MQKRPPDFEIGPYKIIKPLGQGGMGEVYLAQDPQLERQVAIKTLKKEVREDWGVLTKRFQNEAKLLASLNHLNVVKVFSVGLDGETNYMVMEYVRGQTLAEALKARIFLAEEAIQVLEQILSGVKAAHGKGILHRDIKPSNIIIEKEGRVVLVDFGISKSVASPEAKLTQEKNFVGTIQYTAPEIVTGKDATESSDLYSVGVILYELLTGGNPFDGLNYFQILEKIKNVPLQLPPAVERHLSPALKRVFDRLTDPNPKQRYQKAEEALQDLRRALTSTHERTEGVIVQGSRPQRPGSVNSEPAESALPSPKNPPRIPVYWVALIVFIGLAFVKRSTYLALLPILSSPFPVMETTAVPKPGQEMPEQQKDTLVVPHPQFADIRQQLKPLPVGAQWAYRVRTLDQSKGQQLGEREESYLVQKSGAKGMWVDVSHGQVSVGQYHLDNNRFLPPLKVEQKGRQISSVRIEGKPNQLFPLEVGKNVEFKSRALRSDGLFRDLEFTCRVKARQNRLILDKATLIYVVLCAAKDEASYAYHYAPELGVIVREEKEWRSSGAQLLQIKDLIRFQP